MEKVDVKFGVWIEDGFNLYKDNFGPLVLASLIAMLLSWSTLGILLGPMMAGLVMITLDIVDRKQPRPSGGEVFRGFDYFLNSFLFFLVWGLMIGFVMIILFFIPCLGPFAAMFLVYGAQAFLMFALFLIVDRKRDFWPASMESINIVKTNFWPFLGVSIVAGLIGSLGSIACGIGVIFTLPIQVCIVAVAYRDVFDGVRITVDPAEPPPIPTPPPDKPTQPE